MTRGGCGAGGHVAVVESLEEAAVKRAGSAEGFRLRRLTGGLPFVEALVEVAPVAAVKRR
jgi:hypothetical protein